ncbi:hypothetical protein [Oceanobacillus kimchii]|uniref:Secreted protein n=1 Tax=Oceanobacillus kimchii TaxID=746691 RepID=A0ABQ5TE36_9BACI|nr:hypothetical protein [Oceanobacillus kimchii]GLO65064.1 hypothetical protein MACH08_08480 [Oceanobacillus kimchii]
MSIKKWVTVGVFYVVLVVTGYSLFTGENPLASSEMDHDEHMQNEGTMDHNDHDTEVNQQEDETMNHDHEHGHKDESEVKTNVTYENEGFAIALEDDTGAAPELAVEHEKEMHFIVISNDLEEYYHLHPEKVEEGTFRASQDLEEGTYQAFVDIVPKNKAYQAAPNPLQIGAVETAKASLNPEDDWTKEIDGKTVTLEEVEAIAGEEVPLVFDTHGEQPETHLGALGHVVIVDEAVEEYVHVHPASEDTTSFNAHITDPGMYKVWAEFKFDDQIYIYSFILEVKES